MREHFSYLCKSISDREHKELKAGEILEIFKSNYFLRSSALSISDMHFYRRGGEVETEITFCRNGEETTLRACGNGSLDAVSNALKAYTKADYVLEVYTEHSMQEQGSGSIAAAYIGLKAPDGSMAWGAGTDTDIIHAGADALLSAYHNMKS